MPAFPYRLPQTRWPDGVSRTRSGIYERFLRIEGRPVLVRAWSQPRRHSVAIAAMALPASWIDGACASEPARTEDLERALGRARHALGIDDDLRGFHSQLGHDPLVGPLIRRMPWWRVRRCIDPWEALAWAITEQLIESRRAALIQRRIVRSWGSSARLPGARRLLRDVPAPALIAARSPAELAALDLAPKRAIALIRAAREIAAGRCDPGDSTDDRRLLKISEIGPWTLQCLGLYGRGDLDSLPAGDVAYLKLVGRLAELGRRATILEVEEFYAPYAPYRGIVGALTLSGYGRLAKSAPPLRYHPPAPEWEAA